MAVTSIDLVVCGARAAAPDVPLPEGVAEKTVEAPLARLSGSELNALVAGSAADWMLLVDGQLAGAPIDVGQLQAADTSQPTALFALLPLINLPELSQSWSQLPPCVASLLWPPESYAVIALPRPKLAASGPFADEADPLWQGVIRLSADNPDVLLLTSKSDAQAKSRFQWPALAPEHPDQSRDWLFGHLSQLDAADLVDEVASAADAVALKAGLFLLHDYLDESHALSQTVQGQGRQQAGDYWHAIVHRREPDYSNAKYWFRRVGRHPAYGPLADRADVLLAECASPAAGDWKQRLHAANGWDPFAFVDLCEECGRGHDESLARTAAAIQFSEMLLLIGHTWRDAAAG